MPLAHTLFATDNACSGCSKDSNTQDESTRFTSIGMMGEQNLVSSKLCNPASTRQLFTHLVDGSATDGLRQARKDSGLPSWCLAHACGDHVAQNHLFHAGRLQARPLNSGAHRNCTQLAAFLGGQAPIDAADGGARVRHDDGRAA